MTELLRTRVVPLHRMNPSERQAGWWFYTPNGYCVGPFDTEAAREEAIAKHYIEMSAITEMLPRD